MKCHYCGTPLTDRYIRADDKFFCAMKPEGFGWSVECFSNWVYSAYPTPIARITIVNLPTPEMTG